MKDHSQGPNQPPTGESPGIAPSAADKRPPYALRRADQSNLGDVIRMVSGAFGHPYDPKLVEVYERMFSPGATWLATDGEAVVGSAAGAELRLALPGGRETTGWGLTWVGVAPTHRRQGILRSLMTRHLDQGREQGLPLGLLFAAESSIYGRFGYGAATHYASYELSRRDGNLRDDLSLPVAEYRVDLLSLDQARARLPDAWERLRLERVGELSRPDWVWADWFFELEQDASRANAALFIAACSSHGERIEGFTAYYLDENWERGYPEHTLQVREVVGSPPARSRLWSYLLQLDLVGTLAVQTAPLDEPLRWMLRDPRRLRTKSTADGLYVRLFDVPKALAQRAYRGEGRIVLEVEDPLLPEVGGLFELLVENGEAECRRTSSEPDLRLSAEALGAVYLGGVSFSVLAQAGRIRELRAQALARADSLFLWSPAPWCATVF
ncbi:MAG TPA: GNAT family N-acetyltransferase [Thermoleophilia bacterium]|nr:GNAT family N-acetyltransferase [Thermoleophilia bacterium]